MSDRYTKLYLDPKCLRPIYETNNDSIYSEALRSIIDVMQNSKSMSESEINILNCMRTEIRKNRFQTKRELK